MAGLRVLVVDDSALARKFLREAILSSAEVGEVETAPDGRLALVKLRAKRPDIVVLDLVMPGMNGLEVLDEIRRADRDLPVILLSGADVPAASITLEALARGANDFIAKPAGFGTVEETISFVETVVLAKILHLCGRGGIPERADGGSAGAGPTTGVDAGVHRRFAARCDLVVVGVSTGGPNALEAALAPLPADLPVPLLVVQHMPAEFTRLLADRLREKCRLPAVEASDGSIVERGIHLAPGDFHMTVRKEGGRAVIALQRDPPVNSCRPSVDVLFRSAAASYAASTLAVVLTGMGQDGLEGVRAIRNAGGSAVVQDRASSVVWGMPGAVAQAGLADEVVPLSAVAATITRRLRVGRSGLMEIPDDRGWGPR